MILPEDLDIKCQECGGPIEAYTRHVVPAGINWDKVIVTVWPCKHEWSF